MTEARRCSGGRRIPTRRGRAPAAAGCADHRRPHPPGPGRGRDGARPGGADRDAGRRSTRSRPWSSRCTTPSARRPTGCPTTGCCEWAAASEGRLIPFCRLDPAEEPVAEAERCLDAGARGIKLHPRAQAFGLAGPGRGDLRAGRGGARPDPDPRRRAACPTTFGGRAGRGGPASTPAPRLIMAHLGVADQAVMARRACATIRARCYDSSWLNAFDMLSLLARVPAERIVFGSDPPYGRTLNGLYLLLRTAALPRGLARRPAARCWAAAAQRLIAGEELLPATGPARAARAAGRRAPDPRCTRLPDAGVRRVIGGSAERAEVMLAGAAGLPAIPTPAPPAPAFERIAPAAGDRRSRS